MKKPAKEKSTALTIQEYQDPVFADPERQIENFKVALETLHFSHQKLTVTIKLPAYMWLMLCEMEGADGVEKLGETISNILYCSPKIRAEFINKNTWEKELFPEVLPMVE